MKDWKLVVGAFGTIYFAKLLKQRGVMSGTHRVKIPESDFLLAVEEYAKTRLTTDKKTVQVKKPDGTLCFEISFPKAT